MNQSALSMNFACAKLQTKIFCDKVSVDGYEVHNLTAGTLNNAGFLAEGFIKPPVNITLLFPCCVELENIILCGKVGSQQSIKYEIFTTCANSTATRTLAFDESIFFCVGRMHSAEKATVCFANPLFRQQIYHSSRLHSYDDVGVEEIRHSRFQYVSCVNALTLRVVGTANGSAVALRWLEVWAHPASRTPKDIVAHLQKLNAEMFDHDTETGSNVQLCSGTSVGPMQVTVGMAKSRTTEHEDKAVDIPEEFLDAITHELLCLPVLLPSGVTVDQTTLDHHTQNRSVWGLSPADPFTGVNFSSEYKPIAHSTLKARLDRFISQNADKLQGIGRVIGYGVNVEACVQNDICSTTAQSQQHHLKRVSLSGDLCSKRPKVSNESSHSTLSSSTVTSLMSNKQITKQPCLKATSDTLDINKQAWQRANSQYCHNLPVVPALRALHTNSTPNRMHKSCVLFVKQKDTNGAASADSTQGEGSGVLSCADQTSVYLQSSIACSKCVTRMTYLYRLNCSHLLCRNCLLAETADASLEHYCPLCKKSFSHDKPVRINCINHTYVTNL